MLFKESFIHSQHPFFLKEFEKCVKEKLKIENDLNRKVKLI
jgi:hypothetical protein